MKLYETGDTNIWTDRYIQAQLLAAHLNPETDAATRRPSTIAATVDWILKDRPHAGRLVDLGCGPGLYAEAFAARQLSVLGVDINSCSLNHARAASLAKGLEIDYLEHSYLDPFADGLFDLAICIYCDFGALTRDQQGTFLRNVSRILAPDGTLVLDVFGPSLSSSKTEGKFWTREEAESFWSAKPCHVLSECQHFAEESVWGQKYIVIPDGEPARTCVLWDHYFTVETIAHRLAEYGFQIIDTATELVERNDFASNDVLFVKARKIGV